jgi:hypothetical protein
VAPRCTRSPPEWKCQLVIDAATPPAALPCFPVSGRGWRGRIGTDRMDRHLRAKIRGALGATADRGRRHGDRCARVV